MKVLIVDDHALFRVGLEMLLSQLVSPLQVSQAANAHQALGMIAAGNAFDLVILDWNMPKMSGMDALLAVTGDLTKTCCKYPPCKVFCAKYRST